MPFTFLLHGGAIQYSSAGKRSGEVAGISTTERAQRNLRAVIDVAWDGG